jgi:hypothetical protein
MQSILPSQLKYGKVQRGSVSITYLAIQKTTACTPSGTGYPQGQPRTRIHFINCHDSPAAPEFYGQHGDEYPKSLTTKATEGQILEGTVAAVECCYGAELYDSFTLSIDKPLCQSYLQHGSYGCLGSTTIAYGPEDTNAQADLICQFFIVQVLNGE